MMSYRVKLDVFEGPFDLLFHLIEKNEVDIYDIPIAEITQQYLQYLDQMRYFDIEIASEFLVMAATLIQIKSRMLLPRQKDQKDEDISDPRQELVERLIEYRKYKDITGELRNREERFQRILFREPLHVEPDAGNEPVLVNVGITDLCKAFAIVMKRYQGLYNDYLDFSRNLHRKTVSMVDKIRYIRSKLMYNSEISFDSLFDDAVTREDVVVTFLAMLELIRLKRIVVEQRQAFGEIVIRKTKGWR
jgi:segregation and condensation protein A